MKGWFKKKQSESSRRRKVRDTDDFRGRYSKKVGNDEVERHDFK